MKGVLNVAADPYGRRYYAKEKRVAFEKLKKTKGFLSWKKRQLKIQKNRCAYCKVWLSKRNIITHVDHVQPLYYEGNNDFSNLLLTCRRCNIRKWVNNRYVVPEWVRDRKAKLEERERLKPVRRQQYKQMKDIVEAELDEQLLYSDLSWLKE